MKNIEKYSFKINKFSHFNPFPHQEINKTNTQPIQKKTTNTNNLELEIKSTFIK